MWFLMLHSRTFIGERVMCTHNLNAFRDEDDRGGVNLNEQGRLSVWEVILVQR